MFLEAGGGAARRAQPAAAGFACGFALRAKSGAAPVGGRQGSCRGRRAGRPCGEAAHRPRRRRGQALRPGGAEGLPAVLLRGAAARPQKTKPRKP